MKAPSLQKTTALSALLHLTLFLVAALVLEHSTHMKLPSPYIVDLVSPSGRSVSAGSHHAAQRASRTRKTVKKAVPARQPAEKMKESNKLSKRILERMDEERIKERISELAAIDRIKEIYKLRQVISVPAGGQESGAKETAAAHGDGKTAGQGSVGSYMDKITGEIWKQWSWDSSMGEKSLEAVISVLISKDGTITIQKIEKSSGNRFFDRSALIALKNASPVTPPPDRTEMEIGIRFFL